MWGKGAQHSTGGATDCTARLDRTYEAGKKAVYRESQPHLPHNTDPHASALPERPVLGTESVITGIHGATVLGPSTQSLRSLPCR